MFFCFSYFYLPWIYIYMISTDIIWFSLCYGCGRFWWWWLYCCFSDHYFYSIDVLIWKDGQYASFRKILCGSMEMWGIFVFYSSPIVNTQINGYGIKSSFGWLAVRYIVLFFYRSISIAFSAIAVLLILKSKYTCLYDYRPTSTLYWIQWTGIILINLINWTRRLPFLSRTEQNNRALNG